MQVNEGITISDNYVAKLRTYFSIQHIQSAAFFARSSSKIEKSYDGNFPSELYAEHSAYITATILSTVSFLEATINEVFSDACENPASEIRRLEQGVVETMSRMWELGIPRTARYKVLEKYEIALCLAHKEQIPRGTSTYQDVALVMQLRNALVHYEPEWVTVSGIDSEQRTIQKLEKQLCGKFALNPLIRAGNPFFPDKCLGHGCAEWAITSSIRFTDEFFSRLGITPSYDHVRANLSSE
jgi:hypothetical protein